MNDTERQLQADLGLALDRLVPGPAPFARIVRTGRRVRVRRRISLAGGLVAGAALVVAALLTPRWVLSSNGPVPPLTTNYHVTVAPPGPHSPPGLIASGIVDGAKWSVRASSGGSGYYFSGVDTFASTGTGTLPGRYTHGDPVDGFLYSFTGPAIVVDAVRADVTKVGIRLTNGQVLTLRPVAAIGPSNASVVAFAMPDFRDVLAIEAFSNRGEIGYTVPWTGHFWMMADRWLRPDQPALPRPQIAVTGSGTAFGHSWSQLVAVGPWGWCGQGDIGGRGGGGDCTAVLPPLPPGRYYQEAGFAGGSVIGQSGLIWGAEVANSVAVIELTTRAGQHTWIHPHRVGGRSFISFAAPIRQQAPQTVIRWAAYDLRHHLLGTGPV